MIIPYSQFLERRVERYVESVETKSRKNSSRPIDVEPFAAVEPALDQAPLSVEVIEPVQFGKKRST